MVETLGLTLLAKCEQRYCREERRGEMGTKRSTIQTPNWARKEASSVLTGIHDAFNTLVGGRWIAGVGQCFVDGKDGRGDEPP